jgi:alkylation response protein AidB-like acyl-CoA dehydrogenase
METVVSSAGAAADILRPPPSEQTQDWLARVEKIAPVIEENRQRAEQDRVTPRPVFEALRDLGIPRMWVSKEFGGEQLPIETGSAIIQALARLDASIAWQMGVQGAIGRLSDYLPESTSRTLFQDSDGLVVGGVNPSGQAEAVDGGYLHADWLVCAAPVTDGGEVRRTSAGPAVRMLFIPRSDAEIRDTWYTVGLRGTGSNHYRVDKVYVPEEFTVDGAAMHRPPADRPSRAYPISYYDFGPFTSASTALGVAQDALADFKALAARKTATGASSSLATSHTVQEKLARAQGEVHIAETLLAHAAAQVTAHGTDGGDALTALVRLTAATVAEKSVAAVDSLFTLAGATSVYATSRLERCFRDIHSATKHITLSSMHFETVGQYLLGGELVMRR